MGKGKRKQIRVTQRMSETTQNAYLQNLERRIEANATQRAMQQQVVKATNTGRTLHVFDGIDNIRYGAVDSLPRFSIAELCEGIQVNAIDMSSDLNPAVELTTVFSRFAANIDEDEPKYRIYMRNSINTNHFCMLQRCVERLFLENEPLEELQGWLLHYGSVFVFGGVNFDLKESVERVREAGTHIMSMVGKETHKELHEQLSELLLK